MQPQNVPTYDLTKYSNELYTRVFHALNETTTRFVVVYGGAASSKSYSVHQQALFNIMENSTGDTLVIRKYAADLRESCYKLFQHLIAEYGLRPHFKSAFSNDNRRITYLPNGRSLVFRGVDDPEKLKSIVGFNTLLIEEATQLDFEDFLELNRRARGMEGIQIILILNPISENHWIKTKLCDEDSPYAAETTVLRFTYTDNVNGEGHSFLTPADKRELERLKDISENHYRIYVLAEWGVDNTEGKFCWAFNREQIKYTEYDEDLALWVSFDFNVNLLTCTVAQVFPDEKIIRALYCFKLENSDIWQMCDRLNAAYPDALWMVTGDATGQNRSAISRDNLNYYQIIRQELNLNPQQIMVPKSNPPVEENRLIVNAAHKNWTVEIDPRRCQPLIYDLTYVEVGTTGEILKDRTNSKKYADFLDNWRYLINAAVRKHMEW